MLFVEHPKLKRPLGRFFVVMTLARMCCDCCLWRVLEAIFPAAVAAEMAAKAHRMRRALADSVVAIRACEHHLLSLSGGDRLRGVRHGRIKPPARLAHARVGRQRCADAAAGQCARE